MVNVNNYSRVPISESDAILVNFRHYGATHFRRNGAILIDDFRGSNWVARMLDFRRLGNIVFHTIPSSGRLATRGGPAPLSRTAAARGCCMVWEATGSGRPAVEYNRQQSARSGPSLNRMKVYMEKANLKSSVGARFDTDSEAVKLILHQLNVPKKDLIDANEVMELLQMESERGMTLLAASLFDTELEKLANIIVQFGNSKLHKDITVFPGSLSGFSSRIKLLYAMGIIDENTYHSLEVIRKLRNICAHAPKEFTFDNEDVWVEISKIPLAIRFYEVDPETNPKVLPSGEYSRKTQFQFTIFLIFVNLLAARNHAEIIALAARGSRAN